MKISSDSLTSENFTAENLRAVFAVEKIKNESFLDRFINFSISLLINEIQMLEDARGILVQQILVSRGKFISEIMNGLLVRGRSRFDDFCCESCARTRSLAREPLYQGD